MTRFSGRSLVCPFLPDVPAERLKCSCSLVEPGLHLMDLLPLVAAGFIRKVLHPEWLANPVLVLKKNKVDWCMCVDYTDLNKHCPKDPFGLPRIDQVVDSTAGCSVLSFLDCYSEYHQISLAKEDEEKIAFITPFGAFCYTSMPFGLKNAGATYQRAIQTCLADR
jgi:hypothetical protein